MIAHLSYVMCDECGSPAEPCDDAKEARIAAKRVGFIRADDGRDLCKEHRALAQPDQSGGSE